MAIIKVDENTIEIQESVETVIKAERVTFDALTIQKKNLEKKQADIFADYSKRIAEVDVLIAAAVDLGVKTAVASEEPMTPEEVEPK